MKLSAVPYEPGMDLKTSRGRFVIGLIKANRQDSVASTIRKLAGNVRLGFDYPRMAKNSLPRYASLGQVG